MDYPKLNNIEASPIEYRGQNLICIRDPRNLSGKTLFVPYETLFIIKHFDGNHSILDIQKRFMEQFRQILFRDELEKIIGQLDDALLLQSEKFLNYKKDIEDEFKNSSARESSHAGLSYPNQESELRDWLSNFFKNNEESNSEKDGFKKIRGIISPHIDFRRGGKSYALAYRELLSNSDVETFIIYGTAHYADVENPFILTRKTFKTPLGEVENDFEIIDNLVKECSWDLFEGEIAHRTEHSIEFQVVFLQYLFSKIKKIKIVPILCNSFHKFIQNGKSPKEDENSSKFLKKISEIINSKEKSFFIIAGADMAHVGLKFGDPEPVDGTMLRWIRQRDALSLSYAEKIDAEGFYKSIEEEKDKRKICGLSPIYSLLSTINAIEGKLIDYDQALEQDTGSVVSFASMGFYS